MLSRPARGSFMALTVMSFLTAAPVEGQAPPPQTRREVLAYVGPLPAPRVCGCVTPFAFTASRPGWGYGSGPAAPETNAPPSRHERRRQQETDVETRQNLRARVDDATEGNSAASFGIALELTTGTAVARDDDAAARWFLVAASQGHDAAYVQLGHRYHRGLGVEQNDNAAAYWFHQGATAGDAAAMTALGGLYAAGRAVPQDWAAAVWWWRKAGDRRSVGDAYACGLGVAQDNEAAIRSYRAGADAGDMISAIQLAHMHASGCTAAPDLELAFKSYQKAADQGYPEAQVALSGLLLNGRGEAPDPLRAYLWARLAELRSPAGALRTLATTRAAQAARQLPAVLVADTDKMVANLIEMGTKPMNR